MKRFSSAVIVSASLLAAAAFPSPAQTKEVLLQELDKTISESEKYVSDKLLRIKTIENNLHSRGVSPEKQYEIYGELFDEYQTFNYGKATQVLSEQKEIALALGDQSKINDILLKEAMLNTAAGEFLEAINNLARMDTTIFTKEQEIRYCDVQQRFWNDYNEYQTSKQEDILKMLKPVAAAGNIDGMGMQSHISSGLNIDNYVAAAKKYADELGVIIHITELDVTAPKSLNPMYDQGVYLKKFFEAIIAADKAGVPIECVTVWGLTDDMSWKSSTKPLLFYGNLSPKPAYEGVMCAINGGEVAKPADYQEPKTDSTPFVEDYEDQKKVGGPRYSSVQKIVEGGYESDYCLMNSEGYAEYDGYSIDVTNYVGHTIKVTFAIKSKAPTCKCTADIDGTWPTIAEVQTGSDEWVLGEGQYTIEEGTPSLTIYFESVDMNPFYLDNVKIEVVD